MNTSSESIPSNNFIDANTKLDASNFEHVGPDASRQETMVRPSVSYLSDAMRRLFNNKVAVISMFILGIIILMAIFVPIVSPFGMAEQHIEHINASMGAKIDGHTHLFGTDSLGRDIFTRIWHGARTSLIIAFSAVLINLIVGVVYGSISGYIGGAVDTVMMRFLEIINGIPYLMVVILMSMILPTGTFSMVIAYAVIGWVGMARLNRGQILSLKNQEFIVAAKALGANSIRIISSHLVPNILSVIIVNITLAIPSAIFTEAFLSFIGMGVPIPQASWGTLAQDGVQNFQLYPHQLFLPAFFISITMLAFNLLGDGLRDAFDPKLRK